MYTYIYMYIYVCIYICIYVYVYVYIYIYMCTDMHIHEALTIRSRRIVTTSSGSSAPAVRSERHLPGVDGARAQRVFRY